MARCTPLATKESNDPDEAKSFVGQVLLPETTPGRIKVYGPRLDSLDALDLPGAAAWRPPCRNLKLRSGDRAGRARLSVLRPPDRCKPSPRQAQCFASSNGSRLSGVQLRPRSGGLGRRPKTATSSAFAADCRHGATRPPNDGHLTAFGRSQPQIAPTGP